MGRLIVEPGVFNGIVPPEKSILKVLLELRHPILHSCRRGLCGQDLIRILKGWEHLNPIEEHESDTLMLMQARQEPMRFACCTRIIGDGEVVIEVVR